MFSANWLDSPRDTLGTSIPRPYLCSSCGDSFARHDHLARHYRSHQQETPYSCNLCSRSYGRHDVLLRHMNNIHGISDPDDCAKRTTMKQTRRKLSRLRSKAVQSNTTVFEVFERQSRSPGLLPERDKHIYGYRLSELGGMTDVSSDTVIPQSPRDIHPLASVSCGTIYDTMQYLDVRTFFQSYLERSTPNVPFLHIPTLDFSDGALKQVLFPPDPAQDCLSLSTKHAYSQQRSVHRALLLSILTLGALYEDRPTFARALLSETNKAIRVYLLQVQKCGCEPPLQLVQAFVHYIQASLYFGDQLLDELALGHIYCLTSLVQAARLSWPPRQEAEAFDRSQWSHWAVAEERKRAYWGAFIIFASVPTYLDMPASGLDLQSVCLTLPSHEDQWEAMTAQEWEAMTGPECEAREASFQVELSKLLAPVHCDEDDATVDRSCWPAIGEFGCLILILALQMRVWSWNERFESAVGSSEREKAVLEHGLKRWETLYRTFPSISCRSPRLKLRQIVLISCLPIFDHAQLLLRVRIKNVKAAMHARDYQKACAEFASLKCVKEEESTTMKGLPQGEIASGIDTSMSAMQDVAKYAVHALNLSFQACPWLPATTAKNTKYKDVPIVCTLTLFHCVHIVSSWLLHAAQRRDPFASNEGFGWEDSYGGLSISHKLESSELALVQEVENLVNRRKLDVGQRPVCVKSHQFTGVTRGDLTKLAETLLRIHAIMFETNLVQPLVSHLAKGLRCQADTILAKPT